MQYMESERIKNNLRGFAWLLEQFLFERKILSNFLGSLHNPAGLPF